MRLSEIAHKEIIDYEKGERLGILGQTDVLLDEDSGDIHAFIVPISKWYQFSRKEKEVTVHWQQIKKIGQDMIIIDTNSLS